MQNTYQGWVREGRVVRSGQRAEHYAVEPKTGRTVALFELAQTEPAGEPDWHEWPQMAAKDRPQEPKDKRPKVKVRGGGEQPVRVWCGSDKKAADILRSSGYRFNPKTVYWTTREHSDAERTVNAFRERGYSVEWVDRPAAESPPPEPPPSRGPVRIERGHLGATRIYLGEEHRELMESFRCTRHPNFWRMHRSPEASAGFLEAAGFEVEMME